jgi:hypothetical protein
MVLWYLKGIGFFIMVEGAANIWYWKGDKHPWYFQVGRFLRTACGMALVLMG